MAAPTTTTRLSAVNAILRTVNEAPVAALTPPLPIDAQFAADVLDEVSLEVMTRGWSFNVESDIELILDVDSKYQIPANVVRLVLDRPNPALNDLVFRADPDATPTDALSLYNRAKGHHTFVLSAGLKATIMYLVDFEKTPETFRRYVQLRAARLFRDRLNGPNNASEVSREEHQALATLRESESDIERRTIFDSWAAGRILNRRYPQLWRV
jgi:hypothetical protein